MFRCRYNLGHRGVPVIGIKELMINEHGVIPDGADRILGRHDHARRNRADVEQVLCRRESWHQINFHPSADTPGQNR